ncbi:FAD-dependent oxidoreductase [Bosea sp. CS1GBMeth4]|uniref:NAD(P)/FAD-dependent oxidoreductase n=1 Tax=Bosea sp. CS1GBMeth4 TaxID=1892849 RepID=UPI001647644B|nr:FAD-dependent oxidoreductase [Bosea sp. CS1GBMeth4]
MNRSIIVLGAGMVGVSCALALQKRGGRVTLIDRREPGRETSYGNAGLISRSSILPLNNPGLWKSLPKYLSNRHAAVRYRFGHLLRNPGWALGFLSEARPGRLGPRVAALESLIAPALPLHKRLMTEAGIAWRLRDNGFLELWRSEAGAAAAEARRIWLEDHGVRIEALDRQALSALEPGLNPIFSAALLHRDSASVDWPGAVVEAYAGLFAARGGTILRDEVTALSRQGEGWRAIGKSTQHEADLIVVALGPWSAELLRPLGLKVPLNVERGYHRHYRPAQGRFLNRPIYDVEASYMLAPMERGLRLTSGVELAHRDAPDDHAQIEQVLPRAREAFPLTEPAEDVTWRGARPTLPDSLPMIGQAPRNPGLWLAFGNQHIGFSTGPVTGEMLAAMVCGETPLADPAPFRPERYLK